MTFEEWTPQGVPDLVRFATVVRGSGHLADVLNISQPDELAAYERVFGHLANAAAYGDDARTILTRTLGQQQTAHTPTGG